MKTELVMIDSGAFSVWSRNTKIDLDAYIAFCLEHSKASYYVALDVIPGKFGDAKSKTKENVKASCIESWNNYQKMIRVLPKEKVVPVFHQDDDLQWLEKYADAGVSYLGISPHNDVPVPLRIRWLLSVKRHLFDKAKPLFHLHGFGVSNHSVINLWQWHSVDSSSWSMDAKWGLIYIPKGYNGSFNFKEEPFVLAVSPRSSLRSKIGKHLCNLRPDTKTHVMKWLDHCGVVLGKYRSFKVDKGYKLKEGEQWYHRKTNEVMVIEEEGIVPSDSVRHCVNLKYIQEAEKVLSVDHIYAAGGPLDDSVEVNIKKRLSSFPYFCKGKGKIILEQHITDMKGKRHG